MGVMAAGAGIAAIGGIVKSVKGAKQESKAKKAIDSYVRQDLTDANAFKDTRVSTLGAELQREELARATATSVQALQQGGARTLGMGIGAVQEANVNQSREIGADLDRQFQQIEMAKATDNQRIRDMQEQRENADLAGLGQQMAVGQQNFMSGIGDIAAAGGVAARSGAPSATGQSPYSENAFSGTQKFLEDNKFS